jgi:Copper type II ascorbate-dependent monooxygenase, C-terminal domain
MRVRVLFV